MPPGEELRTNDRRSISRGEVRQGRVSKEARTFIRQAMDDWNLVATVEAGLRAEQLEDLKFRASDQWPDTVKKDRTIDARPVLTINRLPQFIRQVTNSQRSARPAIEIHPVNDDSDVDTAEVLQGVVRHIERNSDADIAYTTAGESQATIGRGYWRIVTEFVDDAVNAGKLDASVFEQEIKIKRVRNPFTVYMDPTTMEADCSDARFCLITEDVPKEEYKKRFPDSHMASLADFVTAGNVVPDWMPEGAVRIAEYFYVDEERYDVVQLSDGQVLRKDELPRTNRTADGKFKKSEIDFELLTLMAMPPEAMPPLGERLPEGTELVSIVNERKVAKRIVKHALINAMEVLEGNDRKSEGAEIDGMYIPVVQVIGDEIDLNGEIDYRGIVRDARDPQRMYNYWVSAETEAIALAPKAPFVAAEGQLEGYESSWENSNRRNFAYLYYKPTTLQGQPVPPPQRQAIDTPISAIVQATAQADNDLKAVTGFFDPSLGNLSSGERSGKAIVALQKQGEMANSNYLDNLARAIRHTGRILLNLIPLIYDTPRVLRISTGQAGVDASAERSVIVGSNVPEETPIPPGFEKIYDLGLGRYDVAVSVGPSWQTQRQEAANSLVEFAGVFPAVFPVIADRIAGNMDWPGAKEISERLKAWSIAQGAIPPDEGGLATLPPEAQSLVAGLQAQLDQAKQLAEALGKDREIEKAKYDFQLQQQREELAAKARMEANKQRAETARAAAKIQADSGIQVLQAEIARLEKTADRRHTELQQWVQSASLRTPEPAAAPAPGPPNGSGGPPVA